MHIRTSHLQADGGVGHLQEEKKKKKKRMSVEGFQDKHMETRHSGGTSPDVSDTPYIPVYTFCHQRREWKDQTTMEDSSHKISLMALQRATYIWHEYEVHTTHKDSSSSVCKAADLTGF